MTKESKHFVKMPLMDLEAKINQVELLNELSETVYNRFFNYLLDHEIDVKDSDHFLVSLFRQLEENLSIKLFSKELTELGDMELYWKHMDAYIEELMALE